MIQQYELISLTLPASCSVKTPPAKLGINNHGCVTGSGMCGDRKEAFVYDGRYSQNIVQLNTFSASVKAISDAGHIAGHIIANLETKVQIRSFVLYGEHLDILEDDEKRDNYAVDINNQGHALIIYDGWQSFIYKHKKLYPLDLQHSYRLQAKGINDCDAVVGTGYVQGQKPRSGGAFQWDNGSISFLPKLEFGLVEKRFSVANDINNAGQIVGMSGSIGEAQHAFLYSNGNIYDLGTLGTWWSTALAINDNGDSVGYAKPHSPRMDYAQALLWRSQTLVNLNYYTQGTEWELKVAMDINDRGQIVGWGEFKGKPCIFLMSPR